MNFLPFFKTERVNSPEKKPPKEKITYEILECEATKDVKVILKKGALASDLILPSEFNTIFVKDPTTSLKEYFESNSITGFSYLISSQFDKTFELHFTSAIDAAKAFNVLQSARIGTVTTERSEKKQKEFKKLLFEWQRGTVLDYTLRFRNASDKDVFILNYCHAATQPPAQPKGKQYLALTWSGMNLQGHSLKSSPLLFSVKTGFGPCPETVRGLLRTIPNVKDVCTRYSVESISAQDSPENFIKAMLKDKGIDRNANLQMIRIAKILPSKRGCPIATDTNLAFVFFNSEKSLAQAFSMNGSTYGGATLKITQIVSTRFRIHKQIYKKINLMVAHFLKDLEEKYPEIQIKDSSVTAKKSLRKKSAETAYTKITLMANNAETIKKSSAELAEFLRAYPIYIDEIQ